MTAAPTTVPPNATVEEATAVMRHGRFRHLPVVSDGVLVGVVSERDLHAGDHIVPDELHRGRPVRSTMVHDVITIGPDDPVEQAARLMLENKVGCLPVMEDGRLTGIITEADIFRAFVQVLGVMEPGTRIQIRSADLVSALDQIAAVARRQQVRVISVVSDPATVGRSAGLVVRFGTMMIAPLVAALRAAGLDVVEPEPGLTGTAP
ncbi:MAG: CBS and ACT domain-containing protein [Dehalococcoidia bacterium]